MAANPYRARSISPCRAAAGRRHPGACAGAPDGLMEVVKLDKVKFSRPNSRCARLTAWSARAAAEQSAAGVDHRRRLPEDRVIIAASPTRSCLDAAGDPVPVQDGGRGTASRSTTAPTAALRPARRCDAGAFISATTRTCGGLHLHAARAFPIKELTPAPRSAARPSPSWATATAVDMIVYEKDGKEYLLLANSSRGVMKIDVNELDKAESIEQRCRRRAQGVNYETVESGPAWSTWTSWKAARHRAAQGRGQRGDAGNSCRAVRERIGRSTASLWTAAGVRAPVI